MVLPTHCYMNKQMRFSFLLVLFTSLLLTGCGRSKLQAENEQLKQRLDLITKKADQAENDLKAVSLELQTLKTNIEQLKQVNEELKRVNEKTEKDLQIYRQKATEAYENIKGLRSILGDEKTEREAFARKYVDTKMQVTMLISPISESEVGKAIISLLAVCGDIKTLNENEEREITNAEISQNEAYKSDLMHDQIDQPGNLYLKNLRKRDHSIALAKRVRDIRLARSDALYAKEVAIDTGLQDVWSMINQKTN